MFKTLSSLIFATLFLPLTARANNLDFTKSADFFNKTAQGTGIPEKNIIEIVGLVITGLFYIIGLTFFVLMVYGGFLWLTARGNDDQVGKAKNIIVMAVMGLTVVVLAGAISYFVSTIAVNTGLKN